MIKPTKSPAAPQAKALANQRYVEKLKRHGHTEAIEVAEEMLRTAKTQSKKL